MYPMVCCPNVQLVAQLLADPGGQRFPPTALRLRHAKKARDSNYSYKKDYVIMINNFLNPEGHQNPFSGLKVTAI